MASEQTQAGPPPMTGALLAITSIALALGTFMQVLEGGRYLRPWLATWSR